MITYPLITIEKEKLQYIHFANSNIIILGIFPICIKNSIIRLFLLHTSISFLNYIGDYVATNPYYISNESLNCKIYENFLFLPLKYHFIQVARSIFKKNTLLLSNIKYKNFYIIDLSNDKVIFSLKSILNKKKTIKIDTHPLLYTELLFHSHNLKSQYEEKYQNRYDSIEYQDYFVKLEYTSTYPRLTFIIKFLPILSGIALIHVYSQSKISRNDYEGNKIPYKEFDIIYGKDMNKELNHIEYRYKEPKLLKEIECFFMEILLSGNSSLGFFFYPKHEMKCFCPDIVKTIEDNKDKEQTVDKVIGKITNVLYEEYLRLKEKEKIVKEEGAMNKKVINLDDINLHLNNLCGFNLNDSTIMKNEMISNYQWNFHSKNEISNLFQITKRFTLDVLFDASTESPLANLNEATINLTKLEDKSEITNNDKISELMKRDLSGITRNKKNSSVFNRQSSNSNNNIEESLFNLNISVIPQNEQNKKSKAKKAKKIENKSKSMIIVNRIKERLKENDNHIEYNNINTNMLLSFAGEDNVEMELFEEKNDDNEENENESEEYEEMEDEESVSEVKKEKSQPNTNRNLLK